MYRSYLGGVTPIKPFSVEQGLVVVMEKIKELMINDFPVIIFIAGGSASGKTTFANNLAKQFPEVITISMDDYYIGRKYSEENGFNFDQPQSIDIPLFRENIEDLKIGKTIQKPLYSFIEGGGKRIGYQEVVPCPIIIVEGLFTLSPRLVRCADLSIFVKTNCHGRLVRRIMRDSKRTIWNQKEILGYFVSIVEPMHNNYIDCQENQADVVINNPYDPLIEPDQAGCFKEKQVKALLDNSLSIEEIQRIGAEFIAHSIQEDHYFIGSGQLEGEIVRIRREQGNLIFTYKAPVASDDLKIKNKFEFPISEKEREKIESLFEEKMTIIKIRDIFFFNGIIFSLDRIVLDGKDLYFLEMRVKKVKEAKVLLNKLGITKALDRRSYYEIFSK